MQILSHNTPQRTPEHFSGSLDSTPQPSEITDHQPEQYRVPPSPEVKAHAKYIAHVTSAMERPTVAEAPAQHAYSSRDYARAIHAAGTHIMAARQREIELDSFQQPSSMLQHKNQQKRLDLGELLLGKKAADAMRRGVQNLTVISPAARAHQAEADYMRREMAVGQRILPRPHMQFFCQDAHTWIWHIEGAHNQPSVIMRYHIRPDGVVKERIGGDMSQVTGVELEDFSKCVTAYYYGVKDSVYRSEPAAATPPVATNWALAA